MSFSDTEGVRLPLPAFARPRYRMATGMKKGAALSGRALTDFWSPKGGVGGLRARVSSSAASALKCTPRSVDEGRQGRRRTRCPANKDPPRMRNPERVTMVYVRRDDHALSVPIRCTTHLEVRSPQFVGRKRTARRQPRHTLIAQTCPRANCKRRCTPSWQLHKWESKSYHSPQCL